MWRRASWRDRLRMVGRAGGHEGERRRRSGYREVGEREGVARRKTG